MPNFITELLKLTHKYPKCNIFHGERVLYHEKTNSFESMESWPEYESFADFQKNKKKSKRKHTITEFLYRTTCIKEKKYIAFPVGYFSDDASILEIVSIGGIASSQKPLVKIRINDEQISAEKKYLVEKVKAAVMYHKWYMNNPMLKVSQQEIKNSMDYRIYKFFQNANFIDRIKILSLVPNFVWPLKQKLVILLKACFN